MTIPGAPIMCLRTKCLPQRVWAGMLSLLLGWSSLHAQEGRTLQGKIQDAPDSKQPATWLIPGNGFEPVTLAPIGWGETSYLGLADGRVLTARGDHIAVSADGMKTFPAHGGEKVAQRGHEDARTVGRRIARAMEICREERAN